MDSSRDRQECPEGARGALVLVTQAGRAAIEAAAPGHVEAVRRFFLGGLDRDQVALLEQLATQVADRLEAPDGQPA